MQPRKLSVALVGFPYGGNGGISSEHPDIRHWFGNTLLDAKIAPQVRRELARAYQSGANMTELLAMTPLADRQQVQRNLMNPAFWSHLQAGAVNAMTGNGEQPNAMSPAAQ